MRSTQTGGPLFKIERLVRRSVFAKEENSDDLDHYCVGAVSVAASRMLFKKKANSMDVIIQGLVD